MGITSPLLLSRLPDIVNKILFRFIIFTGSLGSQVLLLPALYASDSEPLLWAAYALTLVCSVLGGLLDPIFLFGMLYYISNVSDEQEQLLYFGLFFFSYSFSLPRHNIQWLFGSFLAELLTNLSSKSSAYVIILGS